MAPWDEVMKKFGSGRLRSSSGAKVTNPKQAIAITMSEKRAAEGGRTEYKSRRSKAKPSPKSDILRRMIGD